MTVSSIPSGILTVILLMALISHEVNASNRTSESDSWPTDIERNVASRPWGDTFLPRSQPPARKLLLVDARGLPSQVRIALACLQGFTSRERPRIWLHMSNRDPQWLDRMCSFTNCGNFLHIQSLFRMHLIRRYAAGVRFALQLHESQSPGNMSEIYAETMRSYTGLRYHPESWLDQLPDGFESAEYVRGWILECMLRQYLCSIYGKDWFRSRSAGGFLKEIWETGLLYSAYELCREIGFSELDPQILAEE